jgi:drug/metabolite transporter (DMT)-like permease
VLWPEGAAGWPLPRSLAEGLGVLGGLSFALNNVLLKRESHRPAAARALAMFLGGAVVAGGLAAVLSAQGQASLPNTLDWRWVVGALVMGAFFLGSNLALQFGASHLPASVTAVVMITEVLFAAVSAVLLGAGRVTPALALGGALIILAALLAQFQPPAKAPTAAH